MEQLPPWLAIAHYSLALICPLSREVFNGWRRFDEVTELGLLAISREPGAPRPDRAGYNDK